MQSDRSSQHIGPPSGPMSFAQEARRQPRSPLFLVIVLGSALLVFCGLVWLGNWQLERRVWKLDLIARVDARVHAPPVTAPGPAAWPYINAHDHEYLHVRVDGRLLKSQPTYVQASTVYGSGYWLLVPLRQADGSLVLINRGFVSSEKRAPEANATAPTTLTGLLRISEPGGTRLRSNEPAADRWFSRDVAAIAARRGLDAPVAPYFIDADATVDATATSATNTAAAPDDSGQPATPSEPIGGLTVISFYNHHLVYAFTWYTLALMVAAAAAYLIREERKLRRR